MFYYLYLYYRWFFFFSSRRRHTRCSRDWSSDVCSSDLGSAIREAQDKVAEQVQLPPGSRLECVGEFGNLQDAIKRLSIVVPISLALIALLLWFNFGSMVDTLLVMSVIPMAIFGGVLGLVISGIPFSVSAAIGFIALFGIAVMDGIIILSQYNQLIDEGFDRA